MRTLCAITFFALLQYVMFATAQVKNDSIIGENITAYLQLSYDSNYSARYENKTGWQNISEYLTYLVKKAEDHFHEELVMVNFTVLNVTLKDDLFVFNSSGLIDGNKTLQNMTQYAMSQNATNNTIHCHCSGNRFYGKYWSNINTSILTDMATNSTFCKRPSAMLFLEFPGTENPYSLVKGLGTTMGAHNRVWFTKEDKTAMNKTFKRCTKKQRSRRRNKGKGRREKQSGRKGKQHNQKAS
uniref:Putative rhipicephalus family xiii n=1 Tax=Rhipicephalus pulchellus TaxID=72859 RepID=L7LUZ4_RHIPC